MQKLRFDRIKYGKELLIDTADMSDFDRDVNIAVPNFYIMGCIRKGKGQIKIGHSTLSVADNMFIFISPGTYTDIVNCKFEEAVWVFFEGDFLEYFFNEKFFIYKFEFFHGLNKPATLSLPANEFSELEFLAREIHHEIRNIDNDSEHILRSSLYLLLCKLNRYYGGVYNTFKQAISNSKALKFKYLLENNILTLKTVDEFATKIGVSKTYLNNLSQKYFAKSASELIKDRLILEAKKELIFSQKDIAEIALSLNFSSQSNFNRFFKRSTSLTPLDFRREFSK